MTGTGGNQEWLGSGDQALSQNGTSRNLAIIRATDGNRRKRLLADCLRLPTLENFFLTLPAQSPRARLRYNGGAAAPEPGVDRSRTIAAGLTDNRYRHVGGEGPGD